MSSGSQWDSVGWRGVGHRPQTSTLPISAPTAVNPAAQSAILDRYGRDTQHWSAERRPPEQQPLMTESHRESTYLNGSYERHTPAPGGNYGPQQLKSTSPHQPPPGAWRSLHHDDRRGSTTITADAPLTLDIPQSQDLPRISPVYNSAKTEGQSYNQGLLTPSQQAPSLPSFATFHEHATRSDDAEVDGPEIAPMAARLSCYLCSKLRPMVHDIAIAAAELDENVQSHCNKAITRKLDIPDDSPVRTVQWVLDRLRYAKQDMIDAARRTQQPAYFFPHPPAPAGILSRPGSPASSLKRQANWEKDDYASSKRHRSGDSPDFESSRAIYDRRASIDFPPRNAYSPQPSESAPLSAYPRTASPSLAGRPLRPLPSPSSLAYPHSAAPSLPPPTVNPGSPALSYQASASIHTTSTNSVTSAHIADLQHQVTLKSLSLQTLQSEYSGLLQKLQRERVKSQTIEKKTTVSEQEVNDLTGRNEELTEQVRSLEQQLEESERKRDSERADATKEKEQWGRMLDMSGRLQAKLAIERQTLVEERDELRRRTNAMGTDVSGQRLGPMDYSVARATASSSPGHVDQAHALYSDLGGTARSDAMGLKQEVGQLTARIEHLTSALRQVKQHAGELGDRSRSIAHQSGEVEQIIRQALGPEESNSPKKGNAAPDAPPSASAKAGEAGARQDSYRNAPPIVVSTSITPPKLAPLSKPPHSATRPALPTPTSATGPSIAEMASAGRAVSPGPEELGIHVQPSTSSPEELIKALGPVPAPLPAYQLKATSTYAPTHPQARRHSYSPPDVQMGYSHASPYRPIQSPYTDQHRQFSRPRASPPSDYSSPDSTHDRDSPPQLSRGGTRAFADTSSLGRPHQDPRPASENPVMRVDTQRRLPQMATSPATGFGSFRQWSHDPKPGNAAAAMPPPPRPLTTSQTTPFGETSGV